MKINKVKKIVASLSFGAILLLSSCGANFNTVGISIGNVINEAQWTSQLDSDFHIEEDGIYDNDKKILKGDYSNINVVGEKIYFYDKSIRTICKANLQGFKVERIGEIYTDKFVVHKDNILVSILVGAGSEDLEAPSNYNIVKMKITDRKLTSQAPKLIYKGGKLIGSDLNRVYFIREDKKGYMLSSIDLDGENFKDISKVEKDAQIIVAGEKVFVLGTYKGEYSIVSMNLKGKDEKTLVKVGKNPDGNNAFNIDNNNIYYENYTYDEDDKVEKSSIVKYNLESKKSQVLIDRDKRTDFSIAVGKSSVFFKERAHEDLDSHKKWKKLK